MAQLRYAIIRFKGERAGILRETPDGGTEFEYVGDSRDEIACAFPRTRYRHGWPVGLHPFFEHLAPEGWLRSRQARTAEIDDLDDLGLLLAYGADCIGAVSVHDPEEHRLDLGGKELDERTRAAVEAKRTVSGVQPKLLVTKRGKTFVPAGPTGNAEYIAKFPTNDLSDIVLNEDISLRAARILLGKDRVAMAHRAFVNGIPGAALVVKRFDRSENNEKLRLEDFAQILCRPRGRDFAGKYDASFEDGANVIGLHSARKAIDLLRYFQRIVVFALLGNCDCHLKNFSLLETSSGLRISPAYDVVNTYIYARQGYSTRFGLRLGGEVRQFEELDRILLTNFGRRIGITDQAIAKTYGELAKKRERVLRLFTPSPLEAEERLELYADTVRGAYIRICGSE